MSGASASSATAASSPKVSMFASKSGFVIPKNKLAGSLVPRFRPNKKLGSDESGNEEITKSGQRKTKWGPDLTQDAAVRKGRALAYQTRVDQLVRQLKSRVAEFAENLDSPSTTTLEEDKSSGQIIDREHSKLLDLEKREAIGEILKLNLSYKVPPDYKPLLKEDKVHVPFKEYPGYNFIGLIFGPGGDNRKRLEKETGTKIQVIGIRKGTKDKGEVIQSDRNDLHNSYEEMYVHITAETFDKVDAAISVIEPLITSVSGNLATVAAESSKVASHPDISSDLAPARQVEQSFVGSLQLPQQGQSQFGHPWFVGNSLPDPQSANQSNPGVIPFSNPPPSSSIHKPFPNYNPSNAPPFGSQATPTSLFSSMPLNTPTVSPCTPLPSPSQLLHNAAIARPAPVDGLVPNPSLQFPPHPSAVPVSSASPFPGGQPLQLPLAAIAGTGLPSLPQTFPNGPQGPIPERPFVRPAGVSAGLINMMQAGLRMGRPPQPASRSQFALQNPIGACLNPLNVPPIISPGGVPRQSHPSTSDFTFQPNRPPSSQGFAQPATPQAGSFQPFIPDTRPFPQAFPRPPMGNQMPPPMGNQMPPPMPFALRHPQFEALGPHAPPNAFPPLAERGFNSGPLMRPLGPFPGRPGNPREDLFHGHMGRPPIQQFGRHDPRLPGRPALGPGRPQFYDPFSLTSANNLMKQPQGGNSGSGRRQENDPEYEDLMASVGVK
ncbi:hypothetical protein MLD38_007361 [Melastoma candidum]|uniref:Uncharacterized protein n=1 Tax=Melastoma candidum TaxID=119954 RepID=A0ACB9RV60_9MYRT|nr:hypothetical protein MLD38_007361 [Melastoma candidum]